MSKRRRGSGTKSFFIILLLVAGGLVFYALRGGNTRDTDNDMEEDKLPVAINQLLSNEISDLEETKRFDSQIETFMRTWAIKGLSLAIMKDEKLIYAKGYGWADRERGEEMDVSHIMRVASVSKLITAAAIMKLSEEGLLSLDDKPFSEEGVLDLPQFQNIKDRRVRDITIDHLLRHRAGFTLRGGDPLFNTLTVKYRLKLDTVPAPDDVIAFSLRSNLGFTPGSSSRYSNLGYLILSRLIEVITGESYESYVKSKVLNPAGIYDMHLGRNLYEQKRDNEVRYYEPDNQELIPSFTDGTTMCSRCYGGNNIEGLMGAGGWIASPTELLLLAASLDGRNSVKDILSKESIDYMTSSGGGILPAGWSKANSREWSRTGTLSGSSALVKYQKSGYAWAVVTNTSSWNGSRFPRQIDYQFKKAILKVTSWPGRNLFEISQQAQQERDPRKADEG
ncbi:MAG: serine hydrolase [Bacteroidales bacterium]|nr:beta-lactamase family protein [Bacteroidales bacterium]MDD2425266.1 serine hydrolase [Bacteroidales bacterium]MDD3989259.1 serine hydrolase [Bacteroidales bacterium]